MQNGYMFIQCVFYYSLMYTQCNLDKILNSVTEAVFWCINLPVWLFFHCVKTAFGSQKNLIKRRKKWNFQKLTYYIALNIKYYFSYIYLVLLPTLSIRPPRATWGPLDSGLMRMMMMMMKVFTLLILNRHNFKRTFGAPSFKRTFGTPRCSNRVLTWVLLYPGFALTGLLLYLGFALPGFCPTRILFYWGFALPGFCSTWVLPYPGFALLRFCSTRVLLYPGFALPEFCSVCS